MTPAPDLPGFWFDTEKKKYFKIQPNHVAPAGAKFSKSSVAREQAVVKKRKVEDCHRRILQRQTVLPAPVLKHSLLGGGLRCESGYQTIAASRTQREDAFLSGLQPCRSEIHVKVVLDAHRTRDHMVVFNHNQVTTYDLKRAFRIWSYAFPTDFSVTSTCMTTTSGMPFLLACSNGPPSRNAFYIPIDGSQPLYRGFSIPDVLVDCAVSDIRLGFAGERGIHNTSTSGQIVSSIDLGLKTTCHTIEWISPHILTYGTCESKGKKQPSKHTVMLWDVRSPTAVAARFVRPKKITGISKPDSSGNNLVVTSNYEISWYDLRLLRADRPLLSIPHMSGGPVTHHSTHNGSMLAAVDQRQEVQSYSWRTGKHVKTLTVKSGNYAKVVRNVRWYEGPHGPYLQACCMNEVLTWDTGSQSSL